MKLFISILLTSYVLCESTLSCSHIPPCNNESLAEAQADDVNPSEHHHHHHHHHNNF